MRAPRHNEKPRKTARKSRKIDARGAPGAVRAIQNRARARVFEQKTQHERAQHRDFFSGCEQAFQGEKERVGGAVRALISEASERTVRADR